jgi:hypothetical protein
VKNEMNISVGVYTEDTSCIRIGFTKLESMV